METKDLMCKVYYEAQTEGYDFVSYVLGDELSAYMWILDFGSWILYSILCEKVLGEVVLEMSRFDD